MTKINKQVSCVNAKLGIHGCSMTASTYTGTHDKLFLQVFSS